MNSLNLMSQYKIIPKDKGFQITHNGRPLNGGFTYKTREEAETAFKNITAFAKER